MKRPEDIRQAADEMLKGLVAGQESYRKIIYAGKKRPHSVFVRRRALAFAMALLLVAGGSFAALRLNAPASPTIQTKAAGNLPEGGTTRALAIPRGSITLKSNASPAYQGLWADGSGANFPLVAAKGRYYRLLTNPTAIDADMLGTSLGSVQVYTKEPALENADSHIISNVVPEGSDVYSISGMDGAAVAAMVDGNLRVFQRVSFSGSALIGSEGLGSTLGRGRVTALQLSGVGTVSDPQNIDMLMGLLKNSASYKNSSSRAGNQSLLIQYDNHIVLQLAVKGNELSACGTWTCADFIGTFAGSIDK